MTTGDGPWWRGADAAAWRALAAGGAGWMLDAMDVMLYAFAIPTIQAELGLTSAQAGGLMTATLVPSAVGGVVFGVLADRFGRRPTFVAFVLAAAVVVPVYGLNARSETLLLVMGPLVGFFGHGYFSVFGAMLAELFPSGVRASAQGLCYNLGRAASAVAPAAIGYVAGKDNLGAALALTSLLYVAGAGVMLMLPETRGRDLS